MLDRFALTAFGNERHPSSPRLSDVVRISRQSNTPPQSQANATTHRTVQRSDTISSTFEGDRSAERQDSAKIYIVLVAKDCRVGQAIYCILDPDASSQPQRTCRSVIADLIQNSLHRSYLLRDLLYA